MRRGNVVNAMGWISIIAVVLLLCAWEEPAPESDKAFEQSPCPADCPHVRSRAPQPLPAGIDQLLSPPQCSIHGKPAARR